MTTTLTLVKAYTRRSFGFVVVVAAGAGSAAVVAAVVLELPVLLPLSLATTPVMLIASNQDQAR